MKKRKKTRKKQPGRFMKNAIIALLISVFVFTTIMTAIFIKTGTEPEVLIDKFFDFVKVDGGIMAMIKIAKVGTDYKKKSDDQKTEVEE